jgi:hypothetical protein
MEKKITKEIEGEIQNLSKDFKGIQIENIWYSSFYVIDDYSKGDQVKITYAENTKDGKTFRNIKHIEKIENKVNEVKNKMSDSTLNTMIMTVKEVYLNNGIELSYPEVTQLVIESYKLLRNLD